MEEEPGRERWPPGAATRGSAARVPQALFLLLLLLPPPLPAGQGQGSTPGRCDCASDPQKRFCCRGCPKGHYMKASCTEPCGDSTCLPCPQGTFLTWGNHFRTDCTRCQACDEEGKRLPRAQGTLVDRPWSGPFRAGWGPVFGRGLLCSVHCGGSTRYSAPVYPSALPCGLPVSTCLGLWSTLSCSRLPVGQPSLGGCPCFFVEPSSLDTSVFPHSCTPLPPPAFQVTLKNCSAVSDTQCGCQSGRLLVCSTEPCRESSPFSCHPCSDCTTPPTPGVSADILTPTGQPAVAGSGVVFWVQVLLGATFLLGATLICAYCRCQPCRPVVPDAAGMETLTPPQTTHLSASDSAHSLLAPQDSTGKVCTTVQLVGNSWIPGLSQTQEMAYSQAPQPWNQLPNRTLGLPLAPPLSPAPPAGSPAAMLQPGPQLYDVMDAVPARRWKEFVRTLGLREAEIEAVEVEICRFRDQQYEMLKRWRQQQPAGLAAIYAALERMGLEGCAEDLRSRLQHGGP
nr:tumor necrosis factor receptor superfamily member 25 isoform X2 [Peromyscus maniculatus bairdii]